MPPSSKPNGSNVLDEPVDLQQLIKDLDFTEENLTGAVLVQGRLFVTASRYYVRKMRSRMAVEMEYDRKKSELGQFYRQKEQERRKKFGLKGKEMTESQLKEKVLLTPTIQLLKQKLDKAELYEEYAKQLLEAYRWRGTACKILAGVLTDEARSDLRVLTDRKARERLDRTLHERYPQGE